MGKTITELDSNPAINDTDVFASDKLEGETVKNTIASLENYLSNKFLRLGAEEIGSFIMSPEANEEFYLECDGKEYNRSDYPELVEVWDRYYSEQQWYQGSDSSKFRVPTHNTAGLFMRGLGTTYSVQGEVTPSTTKTPLNDFKVDASHSHTSNPITLTFEDHTHGVNPIFIRDRGDPTTWLRVETSPSDGNSRPFVFSQIGIGTTASGGDVKSFTPKINSTTLTPKVTGGDSETAPVSFVTKFWVLAKPKLGFSPTTVSGVSTVNGNTGDVVITGSDLDNNVSSINGESGAVNITSETLGIQSQIEALSNQINKLNNGFVISPNGVELPNNFIVRSVSIVADEVFPTGSQIDLAPYFLNGSIGANEDTHGMFSRFSLGDNNSLKFPEFPAIISYTLTVRVSGVYGGSSSAVRVLYNILAESDKSISYANQAIVKDNIINIPVYSTNTETFTNNTTFTTNGAGLYIQNSSGADFTLQRADFLIKGHFVKWIEE